MRKLIPIGLVAALGLGLLGVAESTRAGSPAYTIRFRPPVGKHLHYGMQMQMSGAASASISSAFTITATTHTAGKYTVITEITSMTVPGMTNDQAKKMMSGSKITQVIDESGKILSTHSDGPMQGTAQGSGMGTTGAIFPKKPVHVGDTWVGTSDAAGPHSSVRVKLLGVKTVGGKEEAVLRVTAVTQNKMAKTGPITMLVETATGVLHSLDLTGQIVGPQSSTVHVVVKLH